MRQNTFAGYSLWLLIFCCWGCHSPGERQSVIPQTDTVFISQMQFHPAVLWVNKWDTVIWINQDIVKHDVTAFPGKKWTSGPIPSDSSWKVVATDPIDYFCSIHPTMKGKIKVR